MDWTEQYRDAVERLLARHDVDARSRFADVDGPIGSVHYLDTGGGDGRPPVVCLHGAGTPGTDWVPLLPALGDRRVIVPERPGHGLTPPVDYAGSDLRTVNRSLLVDLVASLDVDGVALVGNSFGGYHALSFALAEPDRVERLVVAGAPAGVDPKPPFATRLFGVPGVSRLWYRLTLPDDVDEARDVYGRINVRDASALSDPFCEAYLASTRVPGRRRTLLSGFRDVVGLRGFVPSFLIDDELPDVDVPTRFVWGDADYFGAQSLGRTVADRMPDAEFVGLDDAGHMPWLEPHDGGVTAIREFL